MAEKQTTQSSAFSKEELEMILDMIAFAENNDQCSDKEYALIFKAKEELVPKIEALLKNIKWRAGQ